MIGRGLKVSQLDWDTRFMRLAREVSTWSKDPDEQVGAVIVTADYRAFSAGYNGLPRGMEDTPEVLCNKELKNRFTIHAERNAIDNARFDVQGSTLYVTKAPCLCCALGIVQTRIARVVSAPIRADSRWVLDQRDAALTLENLGVEVSHIQLEDR